MKIEGFHVAWQGGRTACYRLGIIHVVVDNSMKLLAVAIRTQKHVRSPNSVRDRKNVKSGTAKFLVAHTGEDGQRNHG